MRVAVPDRQSTHGFWSCGRRASDRSRAGRPPFCARSRAMRLDVCAVDRHCPHHAGRPRQRVENIAPDALSAPTVEAIVDRRVGAVVRWTIPPTRARAQHVHDPADNAPIIDTVGSTPTLRQQGFKPLPLRIVKPIELLPHQGLLDSEALNHNLRRAGILIEYRP
jgi:hypothetical protein